jgi:hypothetical protein
MVAPALLGSRRFITPQDPANYPQPGPDESTPRSDATPVRSLLGNLVDQIRCIMWVGYVVRIGETRNATHFILQESDHVHGMII